MKRTASIFIPLALLTLTALPAIADDMRMTMPMDGKAVTEESHQGKGIINSVDAKVGKINLSHEPIASLDWPAMTMDFDVKDKTSLTNLKPGQKVIFKLIETRKGKYVISEIALIK
jgi:Cu(I)/Ag(I) efflux system membrane fusion protein